MREQVGCGWAPQTPRGEAMRSTARRAVGAVCPDAALHAEGPLDPGPRHLLGLDCVLRGVGVTSGGLRVSGGPRQREGPAPWVTSVPVTDQLREPVTWACT